jgi:hypothetical protein
VRLADQLSLQPSVATSTDRPKKNRPQTSAD